MFGDPPLVEAVGMRGYLRGGMAMATHPSSSEDEGMATRMAASTGYDGDGNTPVVDGGVDGRRLLLLGCIHQQRCGG